MSQTRATLHTASLPLRQNRLEIKTGASRWRHSAEVCQLFADIPQPQLAEILAAGRATSFSRKQTIFFAGEMSQRIVLLTEGSIKLTQIDEDGSTVILRLVGPGEVVGAIGGARGGTHLAAGGAGM